MSLQSQLSSLITSIGTDVKNIRTYVTGSASGNINALTTISKSSLVAAINELDNPVKRPMLISGAVRQNLEMRDVGSGSQAYGTSGRGMMVKVFYQAGDVVTNLVFQQGATAAASVTRTAVALLDSSFSILRASADDTTTTSRAAYALISMALSSAYTIPTTGWYWHMLVVAASTLGTYIGNAPPAATMLAVHSTSTWIQAVTSAAPASPMVAGATLTPVAIASTFLSWST